MDMKNIKCIRYLQRANISKPLPLIISCLCLGFNIQMLISKITQNAFQSVSTEVIIGLGIICLIGVLFLWLDMIDEFSATDIVALKEDMLINTIAGERRCECCINKCKGECSDKTCDNFIINFNFVDNIDMDEYFFHNRKLNSDIFSTGEKKK